MPTLRWLAEYFRLPDEGADLSGPYNPDYVPYLWGIFHALDADEVRIVVMMKAAQIGWTYGLLGHIGKRVHCDPSAMILLFPKEGAARDFGDEKLRPTVLATPVLADRIDMSGSRKTGQRWNHKQFPGGFLKLIGSNSISNVKSTPAPFVVIEEPDDTAENVRDQGDAIRLVRERLKRQRRGKLVLGGTPSVKGISRVEEHVELSDKRVLPIACHDCTETHVLSWANVKWLSYEDGQSQPHPIYGLARPETAVYCCPHCGSVWDDWQRRDNILRTVQAAHAAGDPFCGWVPTAKAPPGVIGFMELNELYVVIPGTNLAAVVRDYLEAEHEAARGDESARIVFTNSKLARPYEYSDESATVDDLRKVAASYSEKTVPHGGLLITIGIDVQHDRVAVIIRAWGRGEESWLLYWGELYAQNSCVDKNDGVWRDLDSLVFGSIAHANGRAMHAAAVSIDSGDGNTNDAVYHWVRSRAARARQLRTHLMAVKGASLQADIEIFSPPRVKSIDHRRPDKQTKADRHGVKVYLVGTNKAKDWIAGQLKLEAKGIGRYHFYQGVRDDYFEQLTAEVKAPHRSVRNRRVWQLKSGRRNEAGDCEVYALHAARAARVHLMKPEEWERKENAMLQRDLFAPDDVPPPLPGSAADEPQAETQIADVPPAGLPPLAATTAAEPKTKRMPAPRKQPPGVDDFGSPDWNL